MDQYRVGFNGLEWQTPLSGMRAKTYRQDGKQLRLVEFTSEFVEVDWCEKGHVGYVLEGILEIDFRGTVVTYAAGDGVFISSGQKHGHKARSLTPVTRLVLVEDTETA